MEDKFCSSKTKDFRLDNVSSVISIRGYAPPLRATKIYTFLLEEFGTRSLDATRTRRIITVQTEKKIGFQGRGGQTVFLNFEPDFCRRIPPERFFLLLFFLARTHYHTSLTLSFIYFIPDRYRGEITSSGETFSNCQFLTQKRIEREFDSQFKYSTSIFVLRRIKLYFTVLYNTNRVFYLHLRKIT